MKIVISNESAYHFWSLPEEKRVKATPSQIHTIDDAGTSARMIHSLDTELMGLGDPPFHLLVADSNARGWSKDCCSHVCSKPLPPGSLCKLKNDIYITSPELTFFQMGRKLELPALLEFGMQLCGSYALDSSAARGFQDHLVPLTSVNQLRAFHSTAPMIGARSPSVVALDWLADKAASPMEAGVYLLLRLPPRRGGFGFDAPLVNHKMRLAGEAARIAMQPVITPDLVWLKDKVCVEYDSDEHASSSRIASDARRRNALLYLGYTVLTVTKEQVRDPWQFCDVAQNVAKMLGKRLRTNGPEWSRKYRGLREQFFPWKSWNIGWM